ncbi:MAG: ABC transporter substrate-binding protein [Marvinbryantia sp.]|uniref:ABC transporter substrate-binding protein n=1 Tax=Marvinbryantia sp. TaxID=2496532 RepID=UPI0025F2A5C3|nr:extracellular solute-binding protein [uncultured Marvinbryantia sp.]
MKKRLGCMMAGVMALSMLAGAATVQAEGVELNVTTTFAGEDGNAQNFKDAVAAWEESTGNKVNDASATSDETFKARVEMDFQTGADPDVLFFFNGADANSFIEAGKVVSIDTIRETYPEYAANMNDDLITPSIVDGIRYAVPVNGYWEAMFVNTEVLEAAGVEVPGADYTWDAFLADCQKIKDAGYSPIAAALGNIPHYWWEFCIFNNGDVVNHLTIPASIEEAGAWVNGMEDIKALYEAGYFPENTLSATDDETFASFIDGKAAFLIDGSWKVGGIAGACQSDPEDASTLDTEKLDKFTVTYVPGKGERKATDLIGGLSMGYYISTAAWEDDAKREAAVSFVEYMTSDEMVAKFAQHTASALKAAPEVDESTFNSLQVKAMEMMSGVTSLTGAVQDLFNGECRVSTFDGMPQIVTGEVSAEDAVAEGLAIYNGQ